CIESVRANRVFHPLTARQVVDKRTALPRLAQRLVVFDHDELEFPLGLDRSGAIRHAAAQYSLSHLERIQDRFHSDPHLVATPVPRPMAAASVMPSAFSASRNASDSISALSPGAGPASAAYLPRKRAASLCSPANAFAPKRSPARVTAAGAASVVLL